MSTVVHGQQRGVQQQPDFPRPDSNRLVWVVSNIKTLPGYPEEDFIYEEKFKDEQLKILPNGKKGLLMKYALANRFLGQGRTPFRPYPNGTFIHPETKRVDKTRWGKPLEIVELTPDEVQKYEGLSPAQAMAKTRELENDQKFVTHKLEGQKATAVGTGKPQAQQTTKKKVDVGDLSEADIKRVE